MVEEAPASRRAVVPALKGFDPDREWRNDLEAARVDLSKPVIILSRTLVLEKSDPMNWTLMQRVPITTGPNAGKHRWNSHGYFGLPGQALDKVMRLRLVEELGEGATDVHRALQAMKDVEAGMRQTVLDVERRQLRRRMLEEIIGEVREAGDKARLQKLLKSMEE